MVRRPHFNKTIKRKQRKGFLWIDYVVFDDPRLSAFDKIVYTTLARFVNNENQECYPSTKIIKKYAQITDPTLFKSLNRLEDLGYIEIDKKSGKVNYYQLNETSILDLEVKNLNPLSKREAPLKEKRSTPKGEEDEQYLHNNTKHNNTLSAKKADFSFNKKLEEMKKNKGRHIQIIAIYWEFKGFSYENEEQFRSALKRELRAAVTLKGYSNEDIETTMEWLAFDNDMQWTLETVHKYIDENLAELPPIKKKHGR